MRGELCPVGGPELRPGLVQVAFHGPDADDEPVGDLTVGQSPGLMRVAALRGVNVVAIKDGNSREAVVVMAHHDTAPGSGEADDNGSGVVALMESPDVVGGTGVRSTRPPDRP